MQNDYKKNRTKLHNEPTFPANDSPEILAPSRKINYKQNEYKNMRTNTNAR